jgi:hypothetical protein
MSGQLKIKFKSKKEAYTALLTYLTAPLVAAGGVFLALNKRGLRELFTESSRRQAIMIGIVAVALVLIYSWYKMFRIFFMMNSKDCDALPEGPDIPETVICLSCQSPFNGRELSALICSKCGGTLENLIGFYDRHPELRN